MRKHFRDVPPTIEQVETPGAMERTGLTPKRHLHYPFVLPGGRAITQREPGVGEKSERRGIERARQRALAKHHSGVPVVVGGGEASSCSQQSVIVRGVRETGVERLPGVPQASIPECQLADSKLEPGALLPRQAVE